MASVNPHTRELVFKLVFYGPGLGGKTTTLQYIHAATKPEHRGKMVSLATPTDRTLYFDFLPIRVPRVRGMAVRLQLFTVPGQVYYAATRKLVLSGADAVVFVADSQSGRLDTNKESLEDLHTNLAEHNRSLAEVPHTFHWNKRDLSDLVPIEELERRFNLLGAPSLGTVATKGEGVFEGLERITRLLLKTYENDPKVRVEAGDAPPASRDDEPRLSEDGIARAIRSMEARSDARPDSRPDSRPGSRPEGRAAGDPPTKISAVVPDAVATNGEARNGERIASSPPIPSAAAVPSVAHSSHVSPSSRASAGTTAVSAGISPGIVASDVAERVPSSPPEARQSGGFPRFSGEHVVSAPAPEARNSDVPASNGTETRALVPFSLSELWPASDRDGVRQAEAMIAARDAVNAILACDVLVTRVLASAAGLVGTLDAPRDPAVVALLLGLDGARYLQFRTAVRAARHREQVTMKDALECYLFSLEARRARELLRR
ncbi:gliding motility protein MglA [Labilithrix luteola]|uniref:Gliding motility protein MglA n=1 Tax=Labilithrix luteola TaxID=1391654 RepID=A0A0K1Q869_9BACT|nr:GTPase domain-containing protein [Labilithrix luteola]AKV01852.1 gliding motility protein MglA [Labilithrix luteola]